jgi:hypothetical protein
LFSYGCVENSLVVLNVDHMEIEESGMQDVLKIMKSCRTSSKAFLLSPSSIGRGLLIFPSSLLCLNL